MSLIKSFCALLCASAVPLAALAQTELPSISIKFNATNAFDDTTDYGCYPVPGSDWNKITNATGSDISLTGPSGVTATLNFAASTTYWVSSADILLSTYLDDGQADTESGGTTITVSGLDTEAFAEYTALIYMTADTTPSAAKHFVAPTVNGTQYTFGGAGSENWGSKDYLSVPKIGVTCLPVTGLTATEGANTLTVSVPNISNRANGRACIAAIQIVPADAYGVNDWAYTVADTATDSLTNVATAAGKTLDASQNIEITLPSGADFNVDSVAFASLVLVLQGDATLRSSAFGTLGALEAAGVTVKHNGHTLTTVLPSTAFGTSYVYAGGTPDGAKGSVAHNGGTVRLTGTGETATAYNLVQSHSATQTEVLIDGRAAVVYSGDDAEDRTKGTFGIGTASYTVAGNATVTAPFLVLSQGSDGRTSALTLCESAAVTVTGSSNVDTNQASVMFGHWNGPSVFTVRDSATLTAADADILIGKTGNNQTVNIEGGTFTARGLKLSASAGGTNTLNLSGGTLALGATGIDTYNAARTLSVNVSGSPVIRSTATALPITQAMSLGDGTTLTFDTANGGTVTDTAAIDVTGSGTIVVAGSGTVDLKDVDFGTVTPGFAFAENATATLILPAGREGQVRVPAGATLKLRLSDTQFVGGYTSAADPTAGGTIAFVDSDGNAVDGGDGGTYEPTVNKRTGSGNWNDASAWSAGTVPTAGDAYLVGGDTPETAIAVTLDTELPEGLTVRVLGYVTLVTTEVQPTLPVGLQIGEGATLTVSVDLPADVDVPEGATLVVDADADLTLTHAVTGAGAFVKSGSGKLTVNAQVSAMAGSVVREGILAFGTHAIGEANTYSAAGDVIVENGATLDFNGRNDGWTRYVTLNEGATLANDSSTDIGSGARQLVGVRLNGNATVRAVGDFGLIAGGWAASELTLNGHTLTKTGEGAFWLCNTTVNGGTVAVEAGELNHMNAALTVASGGTLTLDAAVDGALVTASGNIVLNGNFTKRGSGAVTLSTVISGDGALSVEAGHLTLTAENTRPATSHTAAATTVVASGATLELSGSGRLYGSATYHKSPVTVRGTLITPNWVYDAALGALGHNTDFVILDGGTVLFTENCGSSENNKSRGFRVTENGATLKVRDGVAYYKNAVSADAAIQIASGATLTLAVDGDAEATGTYTFAEELSGTVAIGDGVTLTLPSDAAATVTSAVQGMEVSRTDNDDGTFVYVLAEPAGDLSLSGVTVGDDGSAEVSLKDNTLTVDAVPEGLTTLTLSGTGSVVLGEGLTGTLPAICLADGAAVTAPAALIFEPAADSADAMDTAAADNAPAVTLGIGAQLTAVLDEGSVMKRTETLSGTVDGTSLSSRLILTLPEGATAASVARLVGQADPVLSDVIVMVGNGVMLEGRATADGSLVATGAVVFDLDRFGLVTTHDALSGTEAKPLALQTMGTGDQTVAEGGMYPISLAPLGAHVSSIVNNVDGGLLLTAGSEILSTPILGGSGPLTVVYPEGAEAGMALGRGRFMGSLAIENLSGASRTLSLDYGAYYSVRSLTVSGEVILQGVETGTASVSSYVYVIDGGTVSAPANGAGHLTLSGVSLLAGDMNTAGTATLTIPVTLSGKGQFDYAVAESKWILGTGGSVIVGSGSLLTLSGSLTGSNGSVEVLSGGTLAAAGSGSGVFEPMLKLHGGAVIDIRSIPDTGKIAGIDNASPITAADDVSADTPVSIRLPDGITEDTLVTDATGLSADWFVTDAEGFYLTVADDDGDGKPSLLLRAESALPTPVPGTEGSYDTVDAALLLPLRQTAFEAGITGTFVIRRADDGAVLDADTLGAVLGCFVGVQATAKPGADGAEDAVELDYGFGVADIDLGADGGLTLGAAVTGATFADGNVYELVRVDLGGTAAEEKIALTPVLSDDKTAVTLVPADGAALTPIDGTLLFRIRVSRPEADAAAAEAVVE